MLSLLTKVLGSLRMSESESEWTHDVRVTMAKTTLISIQISFLMVYMGERIMVQNRKGFRPNE